jgi:hypothetical protein
MRERLRQLGGTLEITCNGIDRGTKVIAKLPADAADKPLSRAALVSGQHHVTNDEFQSRRIRSAPVSDS